MSARRRFECAPVEEKAAREREGRLGGRDAEGGAGHGQEQAAVGGRRRAWHVGPVCQPVRDRERERWSGRRAAGPQERWAKLGLARDWAASEKKRGTWAG
jgi:hypothetical protein